MKKIHLLASLCLLFGIAFGQTKLPPAYLITADTALGNISLPDSCWQMLADPAGKMTFQQVLQSGQFQDTDRKIDYHYRTYWLRYRYVNKMHKDAELAVNAGNTARTDLYINSDGKWAHLKSGWEVGWKKQDGLKQALYITFSIPEGEEVTVYERDRYDYFYRRPPAKEGINFSFTDKVIQQRYEASHQYASFMLFTGFTIGIILLAVIINFFFFGIAREKEYLFFALFLLAAIIAGPAGVLHNFAFKNNPGLLRYITHAFSIVYPFFFIHFIRYFLKTFRKYPLWDKWLVAFSIVQVIAFFFGIFGSGIFQRNLTGLSDYLFVGAFFGLSVFILITCFLYRHEQESSTRSAIVAIIPSMLFWGILYILYFIRITFYKHGSIPSFFRSILENPVLEDWIEFLCVLWMIAIFSWLLVRRFALIRKNLAEQKLKSEQERSALIEQQKTELEKQVAERTSELRQSLDNLKSTQKQLIQSEKMASLGELTAGIAHEIQNPLNFVNNFSEVNRELIAEMKGELAKGNGQLATDIANDIDENEEKIIHHGKRADAIVKGMLQHSRISSGKKEPTNINALADEYLRLSYHGMRAKDKSFNATMKTDFDESIGKIDIVPQDIGRVFLNLFNNAFYAAAPLPPKGGGGEVLPKREPTVWVSTRSVPSPPEAGRPGGAFVEIRVKDNGNGIPEKIKDKIFQPFFTTKPTGEGTGLGLSLSYDMVKAHDGEISVITKEGEGTEFVVRLPVV